ncbi:MAG TPA: VWA domain-containing protein [Blastocatellia bacterium]|nr:VWA domain-containing protein [Blastocatellia bacterium]HMV83619.1 VWA domain-containing protein [Blastocatellia bacterium]HMX26990.1 VWA domain-containing protein [Blastocatellia bacterium]HMZ20618.1 VWA domain-containing protein [Blastocatellia bacterium]HNG28408.1 VWA domain-containing protein [Blastocatellia bacterium]
MNYLTAIRRMKFGILALLASSLIGMTVSAQSTNPPQQDPQQTDTIRTTLVNVPVIVTDRIGRFTTGLERSDFIVREDGARQKIEDFSSTEAPFNVALLIDTSRSTQNKLGAIRKAASAFIKQLQPNDRVMIVTFDEQVRFVSDFTSDRAELQRAVNSVKSSYLTSLYDAIYRTITEKMVPLQGRKAIVVLTDGVDTASKKGSFENALDLVAATGIISYAIQYETRNDGGSLTRPLFLPNRPSSSFISKFSNSTENEQDQFNANPQSRPPVRDRYLVASDFLRSLAAQSGALYLRAENIENTSYAFQRIAEELRHQYTLTYVSNNEQRDGKYRSITVEVSNPNLVVRARLGYRVAKVEEAEADKKPGGNPKP